MLLSLAAGTVLDAAPEAAIDAAAGAGFDALGFRFGEPPGDAALSRLRDRVDAAGLRVLDVEVVRLTPQTSVADVAWLVDIAGALGASFLLTVAQDDDRERTRRELVRLCDRAAPLGVSVGLEFMEFTSIRTVAEAHDMVVATGRPNIGVLLDVLHLARSGGTPADVAGPHGARLGYVQLCDGPAAAPEDLADEARHHRLMPGEGDLPLSTVLAELGDRVGELPVSIEVQSDALAASMSALERAEHAMRSTKALLEREEGTA